jgi:hypothetical protein
MNSNQPQAPRGKVTAHIAIGSKSLWTSDMLSFLFLFFDEMRIL